MRIVFSGGGTVGHITPAIAIAEELRAEHPDTEVLFICREGGAENEVIKSARFPIEEIRIAGLERRLTTANLKSLRLAFEAKANARRILTEFRADAAVGTGGYVCWPVLSAAHSLGIPTAVHESNAALGLSARSLSKKCDVLLLGQSIECNARCKKFVGNPIRKAFYATSRRSARARIGIKDSDVLIVSVGGSIGAERLNRSCLELLQRFSMREKTVRHIHATGRRYFDDIKAEFPKSISGEGCSVVPFIEDMPTVLSASDVVISRCGAMTLSEIAYCGVPSVLVPSPNVTADHQTKNALHFSRNGAAVMISEERLCFDSLSAAVQPLVESKILRMKMGACAKKLSVSDSSKKCSEEIIKLCKRD